MISFNPVVIHDKHRIMWNTQNLVPPDTEPWFLFNQCKGCLDHYHKIDCYRHCTDNGVIL